AGWSSPMTGPTKVKIGGTTLSIVRGDITEAEVDAVVNAANSELWMGTGVAGAMKRKGGAVVGEGAVREGPIGPGGAARTAPGDCLAPPGTTRAAMESALKADPGRIAAATRSTLAIAEKHRLLSIAFPALGSGVGGVAPAQSADTMVSAIVDHVRTVKTSLQKAMLLLSQDDTFNASSCPFRDRAE